MTLSLIWERRWNTRNNQSLLKLHQFCTQWIHFCATTTKRMRQKSDIEYIRDIHNITFGYLFFWLRDNKCHIFRCILQNFNCSMVADSLQTHTIHRYQTVSCTNRESSIFNNKDTFILNLRSIISFSIFLFGLSSIFSTHANLCLSENT